MPRFVKELEKEGIYECILSTDDLELAIDTYEARKQVGEEVYIVRAGPDQVSTHKYFVCVRMGD